MTVLPRAATSPELALLRSDNQSTRLYLSFPSFTTIYTARLAAVPGSTDKVAEITYTSGSGTLANVKADMTLFVGSSAGAYDVGIARIRKDGATLAGTLYIGETSEINWPSNAYLTVINDVNLWPRHIRIDTDGTTPLMDYDVAYTNQNQAAGSQPTPIMGPDVVLWLLGDSVTYSPDASASWVNGGTITDYLWECAGATFDDDTSATPVITFDTLGTYQLTLTVTGDNSVSFTGYRNVVVCDASHGVTAQFVLESPPTGDYEAGGWSYSVTLYDEAALSQVRDRALCILHAVDYYGDTKQSIGYVPGAENIVCIGRIAGESIVWGTADSYGSVTFNVEGPQYWFSKMTGFPTGVKDVSDATTPNKWIKVRGLTLNKALYHFMAWCSTATRCMDVYPNTDTRRIKRLEAPGGENLWAQLIEMSKRSILADPVCDAYGRFFLQINQQFISDRSSMPTVQALTNVDWYDETRLERVTVDNQSLIDLSGVAWSGTAATSFFSLAPGHVFKHYGDVEVVDRLALTDQATSNTLAGLYSAWRNNPYPRIDAKLAANHRLIDIAPYQRLTLAITTSDTPRGITQSLTVIPRAITREYDGDTGVMLTNVTFESEVTAALAVTGDTPPNPPDDPVGPIDPPVDPPPVDPGLPSDAKDIWLLVSGGTNGIKLLLSKDFFAGGEPSWAAIDVPATYNIPDHTEYNHAMTVAQDGSHLWLTGKDTGNSNRGTVWHLDNISAVRAAPATAPSWSVVMYVGQSLTPGTVAANSSLTQWVSHAVGNKLYQITTFSGTRYYSVHDGSAWAFTALSSSNFLSARANAIAFIDPVSNNYLRDLSGGIYGTSFDPVFGSNMGFDFWGLYNSALHFWVVYNKTGTTTNWLRHVNDNTEYDTGEVVGSNIMRLGGAYGGEYCYIHSSTGNLWITESGASFSLFETFTTGSGGRVLDAKLAGGGKLVRSQVTTTASNVAIFINPTRVAGNWQNMNGDLATVYPFPTSMSIRAMGLVF